MVQVRPEADFYGRVPTRKSLILQKWRQKAKKGIPATRTRVKIPRMRKKRTTSKLTMTIMKTTKMVD